MKKNLLAVVMVGVFAGCAGDAVDESGDDGSDASDALTTSACDKAGGVCVSTVFTDASESACGDDPVTGDAVAQIDESCGAHTFRVCCEAPPIAKGGLMSGLRVNASMPTAVVKFLNANNMGDHHLGWHMSRQWSRLDDSDIKWLTSQGWSRASKQEGDAGNGLEFLAMHRSVLTMLRTLPELASATALFHGWDHVPNPANTKTTKVGPDSLAQNPLAPRAPKVIPAALIDTIAMCEDPAQIDKLKAFATDDDFGRFIETSAGQLGVDGVGVHNYLHNRFSQPGSTVDLGDPQKNFKNQIFWRLHGWIDRCWSTYRTAKGFDDKTDKAYINALAHGAAEMHLPGAAKQ